MLGNKLILEHTKVYERNGINMTAVYFGDLNIGDMFVSKTYDTAFGMKIPNGFYEGYDYNCVDLECGELYYIPENTKVGVYTQLCIKNYKY